MLKAQASQTETIPRKQSILILAVKILSPKHDKFKKVIFFIY